MNTGLYVRLSPAERRRLCEALRWARANGVHRSRSHREHHPNSVAWVHHTTDGRVGMLVVDRHTLTARRFGTPVEDRVQLSLQRPLTQVLSVLAALGYLPARFADTSAQALRDHALKCSRYADRLLKQRHDEMVVVRTLYAAGLYRAAAAADPTAVTP